MAYTVVQAYINVYGSAHMQLAIALRRQIDYTVHCYNPLNNYNVCYSVE